MPLPAQRLRSVLLVEYDAHLDRGHGPYDVALVCEHLARAGHDVHVLTMEGWRLDPGDGMPGATSMMRAPRWVAQLHRLGRRIGRFSEPQRGRLDRLRRGAALPLESFTSIYPIRRRTRALRKGGVPADALAVVLLSGALPFWACVVSAPRDGRWVLTRQRPPNSSNSASSRNLARRFARWRQRRRRGILRIAASTSRATAEWKALVPFLDVHTVPSGTYRARGRVMISDVRRALRSRHGITAGFVALALGAVRPDRDYSTLLGAFTVAGDDTHLIVAGRGMDARLAELRAGEPALGDAHATVVDGFVPDDALDAFVAGADCLVLPYLPQMQGDSGLLHLAVAHGIPVVCSDACSPAATVERFRLGVLYSGGDRESLRDAIARVRSFEADADLAGYEDEFSVARFADRLVALAEDVAALA